MISGASAVSLVPRPEERTRLLSSSLSHVPRPRQAFRCFAVLQATESWVGPGNEATVYSLVRLPQQLHEQHALLYFLPWAYSVCVLLLCCFNCAARSVTFDSTFPFLLRCLRGPLRGHFENTMVPYRRPPMLHFKNTIVSFQLPLRFTLGIWLWDCRKIHVYFQKFHNAQLRIRMYLRCDVRIRTYIHTCIHTYIHTYIQTPLAFNTLMWGSLRLAPIKRGSLHLCLSIKCPP